MSAERVETRLVRGGKGGQTIHFAGCPKAKKVTPWVWAEGRPDEEWMKLPWLKACLYCLPGHLASPDASLTTRAPRVSERATKDQSAGRGA